MCKQTLVSEGPVSEVIWHHFYHILLDERVTGQPDSRGGEIYFTSPWEER